MGYREMFDVKTCLKIHEPILETSPEKTQDTTPFGGPHGARPKGLAPQKPRDLPCKAKGMPLR
jgi:hypothetical protein